MARQPTDRIFSPAPINGVRPEDPVPVLCCAPGALHSGRSSRPFQAPASPSARNRREQLPQAA